MLKPCLTVTCDDRRGAQELEDFTSDVALEATEYLALPEPLARAAQHVCTCPWVTLHSHERDDPEGAVGIPVPSAIQTVAALSTGGCVYGRDPTQRGVGIDVAGAAVFTSAASWASS